MLYNSNNTHRNFLTCGFASTCIHLPPVPPTLVLTCHQYLQHLSSPVTSTSNTCHQYLQHLPPVPPTPVFTCHQYLQHLYSPATSTSNICVHLPVVTELGEPCEVSKISHLLLHDLLLEYISSMDIKDHQCS